MSEIRTLFRFCPSCGKRFHIKLVGKKLVDDERETENETETIATPGAIGGGFTAGAMGGYGMPLVVEENVPVMIDIEKFEYSYKCKHCGHVWSETKTTTERDG